MTITERMFECKRLGAVVMVTPELDAEMPQHSGIALRVALERAASDAGMWVDEASVKIDGPHEGWYNTPGTRRERILYRLRHFSRHPGHDYVLFAYRGAASAWPNDLPRQAIPSGNLNVMRLYQEAADAMLPELRETIRKARGEA